MIFIPVQLQSQSAVMQEQLRTAELAAVTPVTVFISGESGSGKASLAKYLARRYFSLPLAGKTASDWSYISLDARTLRPGLLETVFLNSQPSAEQLPVITNFRGQTRLGAEFSGIVNSKRTVYLTHSGNLSLVSQQELLSLLDVIENSELNDEDTVNKDPLHCRLIASHNTPLQPLTENGQFDQSLFYRLNAVPLELPPLRQRIEDLESLIQNSFCKLVKTHRLAPPAFTERAMQAMRKYPWPGNLDELEKFCERMLILLPGQTVDVGNLPRELVHFEKLQTPSSFSLPPNGVDLNRLESDLLTQALENARGNKSHAARLLGLTRDTFLYRLKKFGIRV